MKKAVSLKSLVLILIVASVFAACDKENDNGKDVNVSVNTMSAKWIISDKNSPYASFEFTLEGNYIVVGNKTTPRSGSVNSTLHPSIGPKTVNTRASEFDESPVYFGTYSINGNKISLASLGVMEVTNISDEDISFSFKTDATGTTSNYEAEKAAPVSTSSKTDLLCRTWVVQRVSHGGVDDPDDEIIGNTIIFSKSGTYLFPSDDGGVGLAKWRWANSAETAIHYTWWSDNWEDYEIATIIQLDNNNLVVQEIVEDEGVFVTYLIPKK